MKLINLPSFLIYQFDPRHYQQETFRNYLLEVKATSTLAQ